MSTTIITIALNNVAKIFNVETEPTILELSIYFREVVKEWQEKNALASVER